MFEGVRVYATARGPALFHLSDHTERLLASAHVYGMPGPITRRLLESFRAVVQGRSPRHEARLTRVEAPVSSASRLAV